MKKNELKTGMKVVLRNGQSRYVALKAIDPDNGNIVDALVCCEATNWGDLTKYNSDLTRDSHKGQLDIIEVFVPTSMYSICCPSGAEYIRIWKREKSYAERQAESGLKVGDLVKVVRKAESEEDGWGVGWVHFMDESVGKIFKITSTSDKAGLHLDNGFNYPFFVLEKYTPEVIIVNGVRYEEIID